MKTELPLKDSFTSTGHKFFYHQEAMANLRNGQGQPVVTHVMATDVCQHTCAFCSVQARHGDALPLKDILDYLDILIEFGLKAVILSGGGNPILYRCPQTGANFDRLVKDIWRRGLEIGLITNGMPLKEYKHWAYEADDGIRESWKTVKPETLDKLKWIRISMSGLDHEENEVYVPEVNPALTTLGFSYVLADIYDEPADLHHGRVSTPLDLITDRSKAKPTRWAKDRLPMLTEQIGEYVRVHNPKYVRLLPNCLEPERIPERCAELQQMANAINPDVVFVQYKPPHAPKACYIGYPHPVLNCDGYVYPCDAVVLSVAEVGYRMGHPDHRFDSPWRICHWSEIAKIYEEPVRSLIEHPGEICRGCVFWQQNEILQGVIEGTTDMPVPSVVPEHPNFV